MGGNLYCFYLVIILLWKESFVCGLCGARLLPSIQCYSCICKLIENGHPTLCTKLFSLLGVLYDVLTYDLFC